MPTTTRIRTGYDTWVSPGDPAAKHPKDNRIRVSSSADGFLYLPLGPELRNVTITSATLHLWGQGEDWGSQTLTVRRIAEKWDASTLRWNARPAVEGTAATLTRGNPVNPTEWVVDVTELVQAYASGARWFGFRLSFTSSVDRGFRSLNAPGRTPWLEVNWTESPGAPTDLAPSGGRAVSISRPVLSWSNENSPDGTTITAFQVQIDPVGNATSPAFTHTENPAELAELDLSQTSYPGLAQGASTQWRVRVLAEGLWSDWSDWAAFSREEKGTIAITTPVETVAEFTPPVAWTTSFAQVAWRLRVLDVDSNVLHDTGRKAGATQEYTIPARDSNTGRPILVDGRDYVLEVRAWDDVEREATPGDPGYVEALAVFHYADDPTPDPVTSLVATQVEDTPYVDLTWTRATTPDSWTIIDNGKAVETAIGGADLLVTGTTYAYRYRNAEPGGHVFQVKPTVNGVTADSPSAAITTTSTGIWIMGPDGLDVLVGVIGDNFASYAMPDRATTFDLPGSRTPVRITQGVRGLRGDVRGWLKTWSGLTVEEWRDRLLELKSRPEATVTLFMGEEVIRAQIFDIVVEPSADGRNRAVSFSFFQVGKIDWLD